MTSAPHPVDSVGLPLPDASWPDQPGAAGRLEPVRRFCNSLNREQGGDAWRTVGELRTWLAAEGFDGPVATEADLVRLRVARDEMWRAVVTRDLSVLADTARTLRLVPEIDRDAIRWRGDGDATDVVVAELLIAVHLSQVDGSWQRLKACQHCDWVFFDASRNRSGRWCSMSACGGRQKAKAYRRRHRA